MARKIVEAADEAAKRRPSEVFGARLREIRGSRELSQEALALRMTEMGRPMNKAAVLRIERGERGLGLDEAFALARVLRVAPAHLLSPRDGEMVWITDREAMDGSAIRNWLLFGEPVMPSDDARRARARMTLVLAIEGLAQAFVDANRFGDEAGAKAAAEALRDRINDHHQQMKEEQ